MEVRVTKCTSEDLLRLAASYTTGRESRMSLRRAYASEHSIVRTQMFVLELKDIPLYVSTHLIRHHVGSQPFQLSCRNDRPGGNIGFARRIEEIKHLVECMDVPEAHARLDWLAQHADRNTSVDLLMLVNAQSLIDMAKVRLCAKASAETRHVFERIREGVAQADPDLASFMVRKCVYRGGLCGEPHSCGYCKTEAFHKEIDDYRSMLD